SCRLLPSLSYLLVLPMSSSPVCPPLFFFLSRLPPPPRSPLFPYTTLFRSRRSTAADAAVLRFRNLRPPGRLAAGPVQAVVRRGGRVRPRAQRDDRLHARRMGPELTHRPAQRHR